MKTSDSHRKRLSSLDAIYEKITTTQNSFKESACSKAHCLSCIDGCGECCRNFMPDILQVEAEAIALHLLLERPDLISRLETTGQSCPFIDEDNSDGLCGIYPARPMVCRLFGFSATSGKEGEPEFSLCRHMEPLHGLTGRKFRGRALLEELFGTIPPVMGHFSMEATSIDPASCERTSLLESVPRALSKIGLNSFLMREDT